MEKLDNTQIMKLAAVHASNTSNIRAGGPFGAAIVKDGEVICVTSNSVLADNDPTAHAEMNAIRTASKKLNTYDLSGCELYATGYPCPMCLGAIMWSNIKKVYYSNSPEEAEEIGFRDKFFYDWLKEADIGILDIEYLPEEISKQLYSEYSKMNNTIY